MSATTAARLTYAEAVDAAIAREMRADEDIFFICTGPPKELVDEFGAERVRATPISEPSMTGMAVGAAAAGKRPIVFWRASTFSFGAYDQVVNQAAKAHYMFGGQMTFPIVFRATCFSGNRLAAQHSQSPWAMLAHVPGLKVVVPATAADAYGLMRASIRDDNPVVFFEPSRVAGLADDVAEDSIVGLGEAETKRAGEDITVVAVGWMVHVALEAAERLAAEGVSVEVVDPRTVSPLDAPAIRASVARTGRLVVADEAPAACSIAAEIAALVAEDPAAFAALCAPIARVCAAPVPVPYSPPLEDFVMPDVANVVEAIRQTL